MEKPQCLLVNVAHLFEKATPLAKQGEPDECGGSLVYQMRGGWKKGPWQLYLDEEGGIYQLSAHSEIDGSDAFCELRGLKDDLDSAERLGAWLKSIMP